MKKRLLRPSRFLKATGVVAAGLFTNSAVLASPPTAPFPALPVNPNTQAAMPTRNLSKTCYKVPPLTKTGLAAVLTRQVKGHSGSGFPYPCEDSIAVILVAL